MPLLHQADPVSVTPMKNSRLSRPGRVLVLLGAAALVVGAVLPWITVEGVPLKLDWLGLRIPLNGREVSGTDTAAWPYVVGFAAVVALLAVAGRARRLLLGFGLLALAAAGGLLYYLANVVQIETSERSEVEQTLADLAIRSSVQPGPYVLLGGAVLIVVGALLTRPAQER